MIKFKLQYFGGRGSSGTDIPFAVPSGGGGGSNQPMDANPGSPDTLQEALGPKGRPMSMKDAVADANPFYDGSYGEYSENCQRAVVATEARMRGYDVIAQPTYDGDTMPNHNEWATNFEGATVQNIGRSTRAATQKAVEDQMRQYGDGARAVLGVQWSNGHSGHVVNVVNRHGKIYYIDGQVNKQYTGKDLFAATKPSLTTMARVDNLDFAQRARESVRQNPYR